MSLDQALLIPGIGGPKYPVSLYEGAWLVNQGIQSDNTISDERSGLGTTRDLQPKYAIELDGSSQYGTIGNLGISGSQNRTCWLWVKLDSNASGTLISWGSPSASGRRYALMVSSGVARVETNGVGTSSSLAVPTGVWTLVGCSLEGDNLNDVTVFVNGGSEQLSGTSQTIDTTDANYGIGVTKIGGTPANYLDGVVFDGGIVDRALSASEFEWIRTFGVSGTNPNFDPVTDIVHIWRMDDNSQATGIDCIEDNQAITWQNSPTVYSDQDIPWSYPNTLGYSTGLIPANPTNPGFDATGGALTYEGVCPWKPEVVEHSALDLERNSTQYVDTGIGVELVNDNWTFSGVIEFESVNAINQDILSQKDGTGTGRSLLQIRNGVPATFYGGSQSNFIGVTALTTGVEYEFTLTRVGTTVTLEVNGESDSITTTGEAADGDFVIGVNKNLSANPFDGKLSNLRLELDSVAVFDIPCSEGSGDSVYERVSATLLPIANAASNWGTMSKGRHVNWADGFSISGSVKIPASLDNDGTDVLGNTLTNPAGPWLNGAESQIDFAPVPEALPPGVTVPGDGTTALYEFNGDPGDVTIGVDQTTKEARFYLEKT